MNTLLESVQETAQKATESLLPFKSKNNMKKSTKPIGYGNQNMK
jgi:hypothetical protein